jgi:carboxyl-terminal processing protease
MLTVHEGKSQTEPPFCRTTRLVLKNISKHHYTAFTFDAEARKEVVNLFMEDFDPYGFYFLSGDRKTLQDVVNAEEDDIFCKALEKAAAIYRQHALQTDSFISTYLKAPFVFDNSDTIYYSPDKKHVLADDWDSQKKRIRKRLKFEVLMAMYDLQEDSTSKLTDAQADEKTRKQVLKEFTNKDLSEKGKPERKIAEAFWNAMVLRCDPHSSYFNDNEKTGFDRQLSSEELSYGLVIRENENSEIEIVRLIPGSAAWKANELNEGDIITGITADGRKINIGTMTEEEITELIESARYKKIFFTVKKKNLQEKKVALMPEKIHSETNVINGYVIKDNSISIGYIPLPAFYTSFESENFLGCANDVAKEVLKLKKENINGLILDLRFNGGGAMHEAMGLAGIFINEGPLGIEKYRDGKPFVLRDFNRGTIYDGPLLILVNGFSASASEFLAAVLQDYNRAVIVGGSTYGKATAQQMMLVDSLEKNLTSKKNGYLKMTRLKFYRVNSSTIQASGVQPDVALPQLDMPDIFVKEKDEKYHLPPDTVTKKVTIQAGSALPVNLLREKSRERVSSNKYFDKLKSLSDSISLFYKHEAFIPLTKKSVNRYLQRAEALHTYADHLQDGMVSAFTVVNNQFDQTLLTIDEDLRLENEEKIKDLSSDMELQEACFIMKDLINNLNPQSK